MRRFETDYYNSHRCWSEATLRALLDSGASNKFFRASCLSLLPSLITAREGPGDIVVKLAEGQPQRISRKTVILQYTFDGF